MKNLYKIYLCIVLLSPVIVLSAAEHKNDFTDEEAMIDDNENLNENLFNRFINFRDFEQIIADHPGIFQITSYGGCTLLHHIAGSNLQNNQSRQVADFILDNDYLDIEVADSFGRTPLLVAIEMANEDFIGYLLNRGASMRALDNSMQSVWHYGADLERTNIIELLLRHATRCASFSRWIDYLQGRSIWAVQFLNEVDGTGRTPLYRASNDQMVTWLLDHGAQINALNGMGATPLIAAVRNKRDVVVQSLLRCGADRNIRDRQRRTALDWAVINRNQAMITLLT